jgi:hypothetical protein
VGANEKDNILITYRGTVLQKPGQHIRQENGLPGKPFLFPDPG